MTNSLKERTYMSIMRTPNLADFAKGQTSRTKTNANPRIRITLVSLGLLFGLSGCVSNSIKMMDVSQERLKNTPESVKHDVLHISQNDGYSCATTSTAMAISYYEKLPFPISKNTAWDISGTRIDAVTRYGNDMNGLKKIADHYRYKSEYANNLSIETLEYLLSKNVLVVLNIKAKDQGPGSHAVLATGYSKPDSKIYISDPDGRIKEFDYKHLERRWSASLSDPPGMSFRSGFIIYPTKF